MRIVKQNDSELVIHSGYPMISLLCLAALLATLLKAAYLALVADASDIALWPLLFVSLFLIACAWFFGEFAILYFSKARGELTCTHRTLFTRQIKRLPLNRITKARRDVLMDSEGDTYRIVIETDAGTMAFTRAFSGNDNSLDAIVGHINTFLKSSEVEQASLL